MSPKRIDRGIYRNLAAYGDEGFSRYMRRAFLASAGYDDQDAGRTVVGIADTSSDFNPCHRGMGELVRAVSRGVLEAGGIPFVFPTMSLNEIFVSPTTMIYRNLMAMVTEEMIRAQPMDAVVLLGGCDKTVPAQLMAAVSADVPAVCVVTGPMRTGYWRGERLGACTDCRRLWARHRAGELDEREIAEIEESLCSTAGTCMVMGTASTMACLAEALGMMVPGGASAPAGSGARLRNAVASGRLAVRMVEEGRTPGSILTGSAFRNALMVLGALGGSTNAVIHLAAIARRAGVSLTLDDVHDACRRVPLLVDVKPAGAGYMEDFHAAGGVPVLLKALEPLLDTGVVGATGRSLGELLAEAEAPGAWQTVIRTPEDPVGSCGALVTVRGSLAPEGAVIKAAAASPGLLRHRGPAVVFESPEDLESRLDDPSLDIRPESVLVLRNAGPVGAGMPEAGYIPIPKRLAREGVKDMVRVTDARMSGTAYGTVVLHCAPEAASGGPLALVRDGDMISLEAEERRLDLLVDAEELARRRGAWRARPLPGRGWEALYARHVLPAPLGADLDFLGPWGEPGGA